ncbi:DNA polymerase III subunit alpha (plasmid) [Paenibacillus thiaminolyticus]|uniref:DNA polymerase III subunit alpha n=1 Tax=Paenibacillus thiaminolyticus TaxID=49283 RepID=UPI00232F744A|nr:DNA polymerase III subunit alpha [Paenibacillus thiaminolyticus]WCF11449.1 DNA polymerase III subunit alpha [Paenibacillus thiaminolyticus]
MCKDKCRSIDRCFIDSVVENIELKEGEFLNALLVNKNIIKLFRGDLFLSSITCEDNVATFFCSPNLKAKVIKVKNNIAKIELLKGFLDFNNVTDVHVGDFLDAELKGGLISLIKNKKKIGEYPAESAIHSFKNRKKLKAYVHEINGKTATVQIVRWADLHRHSGYSLLDGASHIKDLVDKTEFAGAISDHGVMFGVLEYYKQMNAMRKRPIIGFEAYMETLDGEKLGNHTLLLAKNLVGFKNLMKLTSYSYDNFYRKPHISYALLREYSDGIIATSACIGNEIPQRILKGDYEGAKRVALEMIDIFGREDFYIEIQRHGFQEEVLCNAQLTKLAKELDLKIVAGIDSHYTNLEDAKDHEILLCIQTGKKMTDEDRMQFSGTGYHIHSADEVEELFKDLPEALDNTLEIAEKCNLELELGKIFMPAFECPKGYTESTYFEHLVWKGFDERFAGSEKDCELYRSRVQYEINTIKKMGFEGYFLIVWDFIDWAKKQSIYVGPGRGSVVGSLVAYCMKITDLDPIPYGLLFERFLNPERVTMPDIDVDFQDDRRNEVIDYVCNKYGTEAVSKIITFGKMKARAGVRDIARALNLPYSLGDKIAKSIPEHPNMTLQKAFKESIEFSRLYNSDPEIKRVVDIAMKFEGLPRHASQHACGVIIAPSAINNYLPEILMENKETGEKERTSQFVMTEVEECGLLKMDFLGLRTMSVIEKTVSYVNEGYRKEGKAPLRYEDIPLNDKRVYMDIAKGESYGVFQLESPGMRSFMKELYVDASETKEGTMELFERLIAGVSLYRPGPMESIPDYIQNMRNPEYIQYAHPVLKQILERTYGKVVYQEQVMQIVREMAGYSLGRSDLVRRAMGKKKAEVMEKEKHFFINGKDNEDGTSDVLGCIRNGIPKETAEKIWDIMAKFAEYAFNKSHAAAYAMIGIITAWLKYYFPVEYMTAILNSYISNSDKLKMYLSICKKMKIEILPPDVNKSQQMFSVDDGRIRFGLMGIKNLGKASENIIAERTLNGEFKDYQDLAERMAKHSKIDKKIMESMVFSGAVDSFEGTRSAKLEILEKVLNSASTEKKLSQSGQLDLFSMFEEFEVYKKIEVPKTPEFQKKYKLEKEKEYAGFYVSEHPLDEYVDYFVREGVSEIGYFKDSGEVEEEETQNYNHDGEIVKIAGIIKDLKIFYTKRDQKPLYVFSLEDHTGDIKSVIFSDRIELNQDKLVEGKVVMIQGQIKVDEFDTQIIVRNMFDIEAMVKSEKPKLIWVKSNDRNKVQELFSFVNSNLGELPVYVLYQGKKYQANNRIDLNFATFSRLQDMFGNNLKVVYQ